MNKYEIKNRYNGTNGYTYSGKWDNMFHFSKRVNGGYHCIKCNENDLITDNIHTMLIDEVSR